MSPDSLFQITFTLSENFDEKKYLVMAQDAQKALEIAFKKFEKLKAPYQKVESECIDGELI